MARIMLVNIGMHGHVNPTLGFTQELVERGHEVYFLSSPDFEPSISRTGATFVEYPTVLGQAIASTAQLQAETATLGQAMPPALSVMNRFMAEFATTFDPLFEQISRLKPDLIVYDFVSLATSIIARHHGIKMVKFFTTYASNSHYSMMRETFAKHGFPSPEDIQKAQTVLDGICRQKECIPVSLLTALEHTDDDNLVFMPRSFQPFGDTFDERFHFVGPCVRAGSYDNPQHLIPKGDGPVLLISLGSLFHEWLAFYQDCFRAFGNTPWRVVMATGRLDQSLLGQVPDNFHIMSHIPQIDLLPHVDLFISHGGMNSTMEAGYFGVPLVVIPQIEEQQVTALRVQETGLGVYLKRDEVDAAALSKAVAEVAGSPQVAHNIRALQQEIHQAGGSKGAADLMESKLTLSASAAYPVISRSPETVPNKQDSTR